MNARVQAAIKCGTDGHLKGVVAGEFSSQCANRRVATPDHTLLRAMRLPCHFDCGAASLHSGPGACAAGAHGISSQGGLSV